MGLTWQKPADVAWALDDARAEVDPLNEPVMEGLVVAWHDR
jgi:hypothetical protein